MLARISRKFLIAAAAAALVALGVGAIALAAGNSHKTHKRHSRSVRGAGGPGDRFGPADPNVRAVFEQVFTEVSKQAPGIAKPILDKAVSDHKITQAQADEISKMLAAGPRRKRGSAPPAPPHNPPDANTRAVLEQVFTAISKQAPAIAKPILDKAVSDHKITQAQADRISQMLASGPRHFGPGGPGCHGGGGPPGPPFRGGDGPSFREGGGPPGGGPSFREGGGPPGGGRSFREGGGPPFQGGGGPPPMPPGAGSAQ
jgi:hypothetical protein